MTGSLGRAWHAWAGVWGVVGLVILPLVMVWSLGASVLGLLALPARWAWAAVVTLPLVRDSGPAGRRAAGVFAVVGAATAVVVLLDLVGVVRLHPVYFIALEAFEAPLYQWVGYLPRTGILDRPGYLWLGASFLLLEAGAALTWLSRLEKAPS